MNVAAFLFELSQDVAASRLLAQYFRDLGGLDLVFLVSPRFLKRDANGIWFAELQDISERLGASLVEVDTVLDVVTVLAGRCGLLVSASESELGAHAFCHEVFLTAPVGFTRVNLQHGLECIGFNHNDAHDATFGYRIGMACDIAASWFPIERLHSVRSDQKAKILTVGPPVGLSHPPVFERPWSWLARDAGLHGLICENLHSVRFGAGAKVEFVDLLGTFAAAIGASGGTAELRPHPAGRYSEKKNLALPDNVRFNRAPLYKQSLDKFTFGISAPSSVLIDMVWAGIPTAVWTSGDGSVDIGIYEGLEIVSSLADWVTFAEAATQDPSPYLAAQRRYLSSLFGGQDIPSLYRPLYDFAVQAGT
ncbi:hypothetical protein MEX01_51500 [Methylorubrum extorquens]|uniref:hypothetical protein n=1 Tax=Methylorubrum extorquens TaxID=408 RepID=UPI00116E6408|nr:hypothetical protein [Methylorubrum extorquens]GEL44559.1 hypothetical protein MEX01_51500 [Methylorubrum extorquens]